MFFFCIMEFSSGKFAWNRKMRNIVRNQVFDFGFVRMTMLPGRQRFGLGVVKRMCSLSSWIKHTTYTQAQTQKYRTMYHSHTTLFFFGNKHTAWTLRSSNNKRQQHHQHQHSIKRSSSRSRSSTRIHKASEKQKPRTKNSFQSDDNDEELELGNEASRNEQKKEREKEWNGDKTILLLVHFVSFDGDVEPIDGLKQHRSSRQFRCFLFYDSSQRQTESIWKRHVSNARISQQPKTVAPNEKKTERTKKHTIVHDLDLLDIIFGAKISSVWSRVKLFFFVVVHPPRIYIAFSSVWIALVRTRCAVCVSVYGVRVCVCVHLGSDTASMRACW